MKTKLLVALLSLSLLLLVGCSSAESEQAGSGKSSASTDASLSAAIGSSTASVPSKTPVPDPASPSLQTSTPAPFDQSGYPSDTRTDIAIVDTIIDAVLADDRDALRELVHYTTTGCTHADGLGGPPKCESGQAEGTPVEVFPVLGPGEGSHVQRAGIDKVWPRGPKTLVTVYHVSDDAYQEESWPAGEYGIVFRIDGEPFPAMALRVDAGGIVRLDYGAATSIQVSLERDVDEFILPPLDSEMK